MKSMATGGLRIRSGRDSAWLSGCITRGAALDLSLASQFQVPDINPRKCCSDLISRLHNTREALDMDHPKNSSRRNCWRRIGSGGGAMAHNNRAPRGICRRSDGGVPRIRSRPGVRPTNTRHSTSRIAPRAAGAWPRRLNGTSRRCRSAQQSMTLGIWATLARPLATYPALQALTGAVAAVR